MCVRNRPNVDRSPRATPAYPPTSYLGRQVSLSIPIVTLPFIIEQAGGGGEGVSTREESQWGKIVTLRSLDRYYKGGSNRGRGGSPGGRTRRTVNVMVILSTHLDNELLEPVNFCFEDRS